MSEQVTAIVTRGCIEVSTGDLPRGILGRSLSNRRLFYVGELVTLSAAEVTRLVRLGVLVDLAKPNSGQMLMVPIDRLTCPPVVDATVEKYRAKLRSGTLPPSILVQADGTGGWLVRNGAHRAAAAKLEGASHIEALVV